MIHCVLNKAHCFQRDSRFFWFRFSPKCLCVFNRPCVAATAPENWTQQDCLILVEAFQQSWSWNFSLGDKKKIEQNHVFQAYRIFRKHLSEQRISIILWLQLADRQHIILKLCQACCYHLTSTANNWLHLSPCLPPHQRCSAQPERAKTEFHDYRGNVMIALELWKELVATKTKQAS